MIRYRMKKKYITKKYDYYGKEYIHGESDFICTWEYNKLCHLEYRLYLIISMGDLSVPNDIKIKKSDWWNDKIIIEYGSLGNKIILTRIRTKN
jgi:hypothetical protein